MTELATRESTGLAYMDDPTGGRLVAWAQAAQAANQLAKALVKTTFVPKHYQGKEYDATAAILMGDEVGLKPLAALRSIFIIHGTPSMYARTMVALAQSHGHEIWTELDTSAKVIVAGRRRNSDKIERSEWTLDRARKAGYTGNPKYQSNPQEMLYAKAATTVARKVAADVLAGVPYSLEEMELEEPAPTSTVKRNGTTVKRQQPEPPAVPEPEFDAPAEPVADPDATPADDTAPDDPEPIRDPQMKWLQAHYKDVERADRLAEASGILGHDVDSFSALSKDEASRLIDDIERHGQTLDKAAEELFPETDPQ